MKLAAVLAAPIMMLAISSVPANGACYDLSRARDQINCLNTELTDQYLINSGYRYKDHEYKKERHSFHPKFRGNSRKRLPRRIKPPGERLFVFSPRLREWAAYLPDGTRVGYGRANGGADWCADLGRPCRTPRGAFRVQSKGSPNCRSKKFPLPRGGAPMPYCMFFFGGYAIHGSPGISNNNSSHGCIRVQTRAAQWLSKYFLKIGTRIVITSY